MEIPLYEQTENVKKALDKLYEGYDELIDYYAKVIDELENRLIKYKENIELLRDKLRDPLDEIFVEEHKLTQRKKDGGLCS